MWLFNTLFKHSPSLTRETTLPHTLLSWLTNYKRKHQQSNRLDRFPDDPTPWKCHVPSSFFPVVADTWEYESFARDLSNTTKRTQQLFIRSGNCHPRPSPTTPKQVPGVCKTDQTRTIAKLLTNSRDFSKQVRFESPFLLYTPQKKTGTKTPNSETSSLGTGCCAISPVPGYYETWNIISRSADIFMNFTIGQ